MSIKVHTHHLRCTRPAYGTPYADALEAFNRATHEDALREMQLEPAEIMQVAPFDHATPLEVIRSIDRAEMLWAAFIFLALGFVVGALFAIGS